jgi:hypothetical protein
MAYTQKPGRGSNPKTGHGIPAPFKQEIELTSEYDKGKKLMAIARKAKGKVEDLRGTQGINVDIPTGAATAAPYEKAFRPGEGQKGGEARSRASITSGSKTIKESGSGLIPKANEKLYKEYKADSTSTMNSRNRNAAQYNITSGAKSPGSADARDKDTLIKLRKAVVVKK